MRSAQSVLFSGLALIIAAGCGSSSSRSGYDSTEDPSTSDPNGDGTSGTGGPGFGGTATQNVVLDPKNVTVIIDMATTPPTPGKQLFKVIEDGKDATAGAKFVLKDSSLGTFSGATFTSVGVLPAGVLGKSTTVTVDTDKGQGLGTLTVVQLRKTGDQRDFFFIVPYGEDPSPKSDVLKFSTNIKQADVAFVMDTTGSMGGSINALKTALTGSLFGQLQAAIPNVGLAVVDHKDFNDFSSAWGVKVLQGITTNVSLAQNAVNTMSASGGGDEPEAQVGAMYFALTGAANPGTPALAAHTSPTGTFGGVDFRAGSVPVVVLITDASWHDPAGNATIAGLKTAFTSTKAKFVHIAASGQETQANDLSDATASSVPSSAFGTVAGCAAGQCCTGANGAGRAATGPGGTCRLNFLSDGSGGGVSGGIVKAIQAIAVGSTFDVTATPSNDPKNPGGVDATKFIKALRAKDEGDASQGCPAAPAKDTNGDGIKDTFIQVKAGTPVCFEVIPNKNGLVPATLDPQFFKAFIDVIAVQGNLHLDQRSVTFLVPPKDASVK